MTREYKYYGIHACSMLAERRPEAIIRVYLDESNLKAFGPLLKWCASQRIAYRIIPAAELDKVSDSVHHEGICILARELPVLSEKEFLASLNALPSAACLLYLDGVENPHNLGSILRTAAHFGIPYILGENLPPLSSSCCRIAKGGAEVVRLVAVCKTFELLLLLRKKGFSLIATSAHKGESLHTFSFPPRTLLAIGSESKGVKPAVLKAAASSVRIPGTGMMESLNVSVAAGLCIGAFYRQHGIL